MPNVVDDRNGGGDEAWPQQLVEVDVQIVRVQIEVHRIHVPKLYHDEKVGAETRDDEKVRGRVCNCLFFDFWNVLFLVRHIEDRVDGVLFFSVKENSELNRDVESDARHFDERRRFRRKFVVRRRVDSGADVVAEGLSSGHEVANEVAQTTCTCIIKIINTKYSSIAPFLSLSLSLSLYLSIYLSIYLPICVFH